MVPSIFLECVLGRITVNTPISLNTDLVNHRSPLDPRIQLRVLLCFALRFARDPSDLGEIINLHKVRA